MRGAIPPLSIRLLGMGLVKCVVVKPMNFTYIISVIIIIIIIITTTNTTIFKLI
jgi:hypothetical protein